MLAHWRGFGIWLHYIHPVEWHLFFLYSVSSMSSIDLRDGQIVICPYSSSWVQGQLLVCADRNNEHRRIGIGMKRNIDRIG